MTRDALVDACVPLAAELACTVRDEGPDAVADVLARVPDGRYDALAVVLAAMVDPDACMTDLLAWTDWTPPPRIGHPLPREHGSERGYQQHRARREPFCGPCRLAHNARTAAASKRRRRAA